MFQLVGSERDHVASDSLNRRLQAARGTGRPGINDLINAAMAGDEARVERVLAVLEEPQAQGNRRYPVHLVEWAGDFALADRTARDLARSELPHVAVDGYLNLAELSVSRGAWRDAAAALDQAAAFDPGQARTTRVALASLPYLTVPASDIERMIAEVESWSPPTPEPGAPPERAYDPHVRLYWLGLLSSKLGDGEAALRYADAIEDYGDVAGTAVPEELAATVRADVAWRSEFGPDSILRALEPVRGRVPAVFWNRPTFAQEHARWIRASALHRAGEHQEALRWLDNSFTVTPSWAKNLGPVAYQRARVLEALGREQEAREARDSYRELWTDPDDGTVPKG